MDTKRCNRLILAVLAIVLFAGMAGCSGGEETTRYQSPPVRDQAFAMLDDYGSWLPLAPYGTVWSPWVASDWRPFTYGHWAWSNGGWVWVGYEPFSWVVDHYGFWHLDRQEGWLWIPGYEWSAANVTWISTDEYFCWAPLPPSGVILPLPGDPYWEQMWVVVPAPDFTHDKVGHYRTKVDALRGGSTVRGGARRSPDPRDVERRTGKRVENIQTRDEKVKVGGRDLVRLAWPPEDTRRVEAHADEVKREVLRRSREPGEQEPIRVGGKEDQKITPPQPVQIPEREKKDEEKSATPRPPDRVQPQPEKPLPPVTPPKAEPPKEVKKETKKQTPAPASKEKKKEKAAPKAAPKADEPETDKK